MLTLLFLLVQHPILHALDGLELEGKGLHLLVVVVVIAGGGAVGVVKGRKEGGGWHSGGWWRRWWGWLFLAREAIGRKGLVGSVVVVAAAEIIVVEMVVVVVVVVVAPVLFIATTTSTTSNAGMGMRASKEIGPGCGDTLGRSLLIGLWLPILHTDLQILQDGVAVGQILQLFFHGVSFGAQFAALILPGGFAEGTKGGRIGGAVFGVRGAFVESRLGVDGHERGKGGHLRAATPAIDRHGVGIGGIPGLVLLLFTAGGRHVARRFGAPRRNVEAFNCL